MAYRRIYGIGSVWQTESVADHCGTFRWELEVFQAGTTIYWDIDVIAAISGSDGTDIFNADVKAAAIDYPCLPQGEAIGKRITIGCVTLTKGQNSGFTVGTSVGASASGVQGSVGINYTPGFLGKSMQWEVRLQVCPGAACPEVKVLKNETKAPTGYKWYHYCAGDVDEKSTSELTEQQPQCKVCDCDVQAQRDLKLPLSPGGLISTANPQ